MNLAIALLVYLAVMLTVVVIQLGGLKVRLDRLLRREDGASK